MHRLVKEILKRTLYQIKIEKYVQKLISKSFRFTTSFVIASIEVVLYYNYIHMERRDAEM